MDMTPKYPELETETPTRIQQAKPISFSNGIIKRHHHPISVTYKECLKNHAAAIGGHALDGCGEFMPSPSSSPSDPTSIKCGACGCHRNFHRREPDDSSYLSSVVPPSSLPKSSTTTAVIEYQPHHRHHPLPPPHPVPCSPNSSSPPPISSSYMLLALSGSNKPAGNNLPFSDLNFAANNISNNHHTGSRKRFRTKFSTNQKEKMHEFADRVGWKIQKRDEDDVRDFCREIGVDKGVLKVWMHNNKNTFNNRRDDQQLPVGVRINNGVGNHIAVSNDNNNNADDDHEARSRSGLEHDLHRSGGGRFESDSGEAECGNANGSSSSS